MKTHKCVQILEKGILLIFTVSFNWHLIKDQTTVTTEIDELQTNLKFKVAKLNKMEGLYN